jgi:ABC-type polysaccharide/polyol phosphate export permease
MGFAANRLAFNSRFWYVAPRNWRPGIANEAIGGNWGMSQYLAAIWKCRYFWFSLVRLDLRSRYRRSALGVGWSLLQPIAMTAVICAVFATLFQKDVREYGPWLMVGLCFWNFITTSTLLGCQCLVLGERYIRQYPAPMAIYPLRTVLGSSFHFAMALGVVLVMRFGLIGFSGISSFVSLVPTLAMLVVVGWSLAVLAGFVTTYFPDMQHLTEVGLQILFYGTPIIYPPEMLRERGVGWLVDYNPLAAFVELLREPLLNGVVPPLWLFGLAALSTATIAGAATLTLVCLQKKIIFQL